MSRVRALVAHLRGVPLATLLAQGKPGATPQEIMEAVWVAAEMRAGGAYAHSAISLGELSDHGHAS